MRYIYFLLIPVLLYFTGCKSAKEEPTVTKSVAADSSFNVPVSNLYFVALFEGKPCVYSHSVSSGSNEIIWSSRNQSVIELLYSRDGKKVFFLTSTEYGKKGVFTYFNSLTLYMFDYAVPGKVSKITAAGDCVNYKLFSEDNNVIRLETNMLSDGEHKTVKNKKWLIDLSGTILEKKEKLVDITVEGFPQLAKPPLDFVSGDGKYALAINKEEMIVFKELSTRGYSEITKADKQINQIGFSPDAKQVIFTLVDVSPSNETLYDENPETSELIIYSYGDKKINLRLKGSGMKNFMIWGDLLVFDNAFGEKSELVLYNLKTLQEIKRISLKGGAGVFSIPTIPNYEA